VKYLLIVFVIFLALAPLSHFIPSKHQRKVARLRERAAVDGLFVEFRKTPEDSRGEKLGNGPLIFYGKRLPPRRGPRIQHTVFVLDDWGWRGLNRAAEAPPVLTGLPAGITLAAQDDGTCGVFWNEEGDEAELQQIVAVLEEWNRQLRPARGEIS
jgi:hypothetical protein